MKKIAISLGIIGVVAAIVIGATTAYFSDTETSKGNTLTAGVIDIVVDDKNPWTADGQFVLEDMKPSYTKYIEFTVRNLEESNEVVLWKHIKITGRDGGTITEPECEEEGGEWTGTGCNGNTPRDNLDPYIIYDLYVCKDPGEEQKCLTDGDSKPVDIGEWTPIITEDQYVRLDNVSSAWIKIGQLVPTKELKVVQSYHLSSWPGAAEPEVTNWAQGDVLTFDIELMATQMNAPGPKGYFDTLNMENKNPVTWEVISGDDIKGQLTYKTSGDEFDYSFSGVAPQKGVSYSLIYASDPWPQTGIVIDSAVSDAGTGSISMSGVKNLGTDLPAVYDINPGAKIWLVLSSDHDGTKMTAWNPTEYLFEMQFITYDDTDL